MTAPTSETTLLIWYCQSCRKSCKVQPPNEDPACTCKTPVPALRPTEVTVLHTPKARPMHALSDEEGRIRALARKGTKVRVTFEAEVVDAMQWSSAGDRGLSFTVRTSDRRRFTFNPQLEGLYIEGIPQEDG
ncbi:hypothetical protein AB0G67_40350 [Streptomyces sp. NPDC021056]|uniref:hypothetical protein n=1 Tax=Streptomyces sp. NPDC021056 TaxID=3155012 RepID=UPI0033D0E421